MHMRCMWPARCRLTLTPFCDSGEKQIRPAPRLSRTPAQAGRAEPETGEHTLDVLRKLLPGKSEAALQKLASAGIIGGVGLQSKL